MHLGRIQHGADKCAVVAHLLCGQPELYVLIIVLSQSAYTNEVYSNKYEFESSCFITTMRLVHKSHFQSYNMLKVVCFDQTVVAYHTDSQWLKTSMLLCSSSASMNHTSGWVHMCLWMNTL